MKKQNEDSIEMKIVRFLKKIEKLVKKFSSERTIVEFNHDGFALKYDHWPIWKPTCERSVRWNDVRRIYACMWDAFVGYGIGLLFDDGAKKPICVGESRKGYKEFSKYVSKNFPGFNSHNVQEIEKVFCFTDICFPCWDKDKPIDDLVIRDKYTIEGLDIKTEKIIVRKKDGKPFTGGDNNG